MLTMTLCLTSCAKQVLTWQWESFSGSLCRHSGYDDYARDEVTPVGSAVPQYLVAIEEGANGVVDNVYQAANKSQAIQREFPDVNITPECKRITDKPDEDLDLFDAIIFDQWTGRYHYHVIWPYKQQELGICWNG